MAMRINRITDNHHSIFDDREFVRKFALLLGLITAVSLFLIYHSFHQMNSLAAYHPSDTTKTPLSLSAVEREMNGNVISLDSLEGDVDDLVDQDLQALDALEQKSATDSAVLAKSKALAKVKSRGIVITSVEIPHKRVARRPLKSLRKKFYATNNVKYALEIAERYYGAKQYQKALKWALIANEVDEKKPQSWILFAKTKMKMGKKQDALNVLKAYLKTYSSAKVSRYLKKIAAS